MMNRSKDIKRKRVHSFFQENKKIRLDNPPELLEVVIDPNEPPVLPPSDIRYDQARVIRKINSYFRQIDCPLIEDDGQCHGMSVVWLLKMAEGKIDWFYRTRDVIIIFPLSHMELIDQDVKEFARMIDKAQNLRKYLPDQPFQNPQVDFGTDNIKSIKFTGTARELRTYFHNMRSVVMYEISGYEHSVAIYQSDGVYHIFDSNYLDGEAKIINDHNALQNELIECFFKTFNDPVPEILRFNLLQIRDPKALRYVAPNAEECDDHVALESKDDVPTSSRCSLL